MENSRYTINVRLRKKDVDLIQWYDSLPETEDKSRLVRDLIREGLKSMSRGVTSNISRPVPAFSIEKPAFEVTEQSIDDLMSNF